jgi:phosphoribosylaminoimidazole-succinocarboxamide synthase
MSLGNKLYEGKAKIIYTTDDPNIVLTHYKDDATAFNGQKKGAIAGKGVMNCTIAANLFKWLMKNQIATHFIDQPEPHQMVVKKVDIIPLEVVVRNIAAGSLCRQTGLPQGQVLPQPLVDFYYKDDSLGDPLLTKDRIFLLDLASPEQLQEIIDVTLKINGLLQEFLDRCAITLVDFKLEFGRDSEGKLLLADEISPDTCRLWDQTAADDDTKVMDKDRFRQDLGHVESAYEQVQSRILAAMAGL